MTNDIMYPDNYSNYLGIAVTVCDLVKVKQGLVDALLQLEGYLHGIKTCSPLITVRFLQTTSTFHYIQSFIEETLEKFSSFSTNMY